MHGGIDRLVFVPCGGDEVTARGEVIDHFRHGRRRLDVRRADDVTFLELIELVTVVIVVHRGDGPPIFVAVETTGLERVAGTRTQIRLDDTDTNQFITQQSLLQQTRTDPILVLDLVSDYLVGVLRELYPILAYDLPL